MKRSYSTSFKIQAVEKALNRNENTQLNEIAKSLGVSASTLCTWITKAKNQEFETASINEIASMSNDKRPQDWSREDRFNMIIESGSLSEEELNARCREQGIYPHHIEQWKLDFIKGDTVKQRVVSPSEMKDLKHENKSLKKELNRKDRALAETAALLVLQKKVQDIWGDDEDS